MQGVSSPNTKADFQNATMYFMIFRAGHFTSKPKHSYTFIYSGNQSSSGIDTSCDAFYGNIGSILILEKNYTSHIHLWESLVPK